MRTQRTDLAVILLAVARAVWWLTHWRGGSNHPSGRWLSGCMGTRPQPGFAHFSAYGVPVVRAGREA